MLGTSWLLVYMQNEFWGSPNGIILGGSAIVTSNTNSYIGQGGFGLCSNLAEPTGLRVIYDFEMSFTWNMEQLFVIQQDFTWAIGEQFLRWFQVNSSPIPPSQNTSGCNNCPNPVGVFPQCQMNYIAATTVSQVCMQLAQIGFTPQ